MTRLTIGGKTDPLVKATVGLELVTIIAIEFLSIHRWNVGSEMALMIETQYIRIARIHPFQLKFRMRFPKRSERRGKTLRRPRQFEGDLLRGVRMSMKRVPRNAHSSLSRRRHRCGIVVARHALRARNES